MVFDVGAYDLVVSKRAFTASRKVCLGGLAHLAERAAVL
jgi:hypothetical protein